MASIVFFGNCQAEAVGNVFRRFVAPWSDDRATFVNAYKPIGPAEREAIRNADAIVSQVTDLEPDFALEALGPHQRRVLFPVASAAFLWPFSGDPHPLNAPTALQPGGPWAQEYGDRFLNRLIRNRVPPEDALQQYVSLDVNKVVNLDRLYELHIDRQKQRDQATGFDVAGLIERFFREEPVFFTDYHPRLRIAKYVIDGVFRALQVADDAIQRLEAYLQVSPFPKEEAPIHPSVIRHFGIRAGYHDHWNFMDMERVRFEEHVRRYLAYDWNPVLAEGISLSAKGDAATALARLREGLARSPGSGRGQAALSTVLNRLKEHDAALAAAERAAALEPDDPRILARYGDQLILAGRLDAAEEIVGRALRLAPGDVSIHRLRVRILSRTGRGPDAVAAAEGAMRIEPRRAELVSLHGRMLAAVEDSAGAEAAFRRAAELAPASGEYSEELARFLAKLGRIEPAIAEAREAIRREPKRLSAILFLSSLHAQADDLSNAESVLREALERMPDRGLLWHDLGRLLLRQKKLEEAQRAAARAVEVRPDNPAFHSLHAVTSERLEQMEKAEAEFVRAAELEPEKPRYQEDLARFYVRTRRVGEAIAVGQKAIALAPHNIGLLLLVGPLLDQRGYHDDAERLLQQAVGLAPRNARAHLDLSRHFWRRKLGDRAIEEARLAVSLAPNEKDIVRHCERLEKARRDELFAQSWVPPGARAVPMPSRRGGMAVAAAKLRSWASSGFRRGGRAPRTED